MEDHKVSFELAVLAKEKGFREYTATGYAQNGDIYLHQGGQESVITGQKYFEGSSYKGSPFLCSRPTQSLLQKWLREVHDLEIHISCVTQHNEVKKSCKLVHYQYFVKSKSQYYFIRIENEGFKTYELALEDALLESLKLIK